MTKESRSSGARLEGDGLLRLGGALASNNQHNENADIIKWLESASVDDLRLAFPVLLNWIRNATKKAKKEAKHPNTMAATTATANSAQDSPDPIVLQQTISNDEVAEKIVSVLEEAIEYDAEATMMDAQETAKKDSISALRMALAGYLHANHKKMRKIPPVANLEKRIKAKVSFDRAAIHTLDLVNAAGPDPHSVSQYISLEEETEHAWEVIPKLHIDLGLGLAQTSPADVCAEFIRDKKPVLHPFTGQAVARMHVKKVIPSKRKPVWIEYFDANDRPLKPDTLAKQGDDLRNDFSVACVSKLCETIWHKAPIAWTLKSPPTVCAYNVLVTDKDAGYLEMVPGKNFLDLSEANKDEESWKDVDIRKLAPSLIGAYITNFILGVRDRHEDNMMVVGDLKENPRMMQIDFGYVLMEYPGGVHYDMPRLTMPISLVDRFQAEPGRVEGTTLMEDLQHDMLAAYLVLRRHSQQLIPFCAHLMSSSHDYKHVESVLEGKHSFRTDKSERKVIKWMSQKLLNQWAHFYFRREIKLGMVRGYYKYVEFMTFVTKKLDNNNNNNDDETITRRASERIKNFFTNATTTTTTTTNNNKPARQRAMSGSSESDRDEDEDDDEVCYHSYDLESLSELNDKVSDAMKMSKQVSASMITQNETHGTLDMIGNDDDKEEKA